MSKETQEPTEENLFAGFNLLKDDALAAPTKEVKETKKEPAAPAPDAEDKVTAALEAAKKEADDIAAKKASKKTIETQEEEQEEITPEAEIEEEFEEGSLKPFVSHMASKGLLDYEEGVDEFEDSEEYLENLQRKTVNNGINKWKAGYDEDTQKYLEFVENGGNPKDFHKIYYNENTFADVTITGDEDMQKHVIKEGLLNAGWDPEDIEDEIGLYEDAGKLEAKAGVYLKKLQKLESDNKELLVAAQKKFAEDEKQKAKADWDSFKKGLYDTDKIADFKFTPKMKDELWDYMTKPLDKKTGLTQYQKDSQEKGPEARYIFAYLMKNNWDASKLEKELKNKVVSGVKKKLSNYSDSRNKLKSGESRPIDKDAEASAFAGFRKLGV